VSIDKQIEEVVSIIKKKSIGIEKMIGSAGIVVS
jgi:hypothetical protein